MPAGNVVYFYVEKKISRLSSERREGREQENGGREEGGLVNALFHTFCHICGRLISTVYNTYVCMCTVCVFS